MFLKIQVNTSAAPAAGATEAAAAQMQLTTEAMRDQTVTRGASNGERMAVWNF